MAMGKNLVPLATVIVVVVIVASFVAIGSAKNLHASMEMYTDLPGRHAIALKVHSCNDQVMYTLQRLRNELPTSVPIIVVFDNTKGGFKQELARHLTPYLLSTDQQLQQVNGLHKDTWYNNDSLLISLWRSGMLSPDTDFLWLIEYDVFCDGNWFHAMASTSGMMHDMLATYMERYNQSNETWMWWPHMNATNEKDIVPRKRRVKSFAPVCRFSRRAMQVLDAHAGRTSGYCEVYIPTILDASNCTWANLPNSMLGDFQCFETCKSSRPPTRNDNRLHHKMVWDTALRT